MPFANSGVKLQARRKSARLEAFDFTTKGILQEACKLTQFWRWMVQWMVGGMGGWDVWRLRVQVLGKTVLAHGKVPVPWTSCGMGLWPVTPVSKFFHPSETLFWSSAFFGWGIPLHPMYNDHHGEHLVWVLRFLNPMNRRFELYEV